MNMHAVRSAARAAGVLLALAAALPAGAQRRDGAPAAAEALEAIAARLSARYHLPVLVDPALAPMLRAAPPEPAADLPMERAFDTLAASIAAKGVAWRLVSVRAGAGDAATLAATVRALDRMAQSGVAVEDTAARRADLALRDRSGADDLGSLAWAPAGPGEQPRVLLYSTTATTDGRSAAEQFADLQRRQAELMDRLPPDQRANPMLQTVQLLQRLDPATMQTMLQPMMEAGNAAWEGTPPDQRQQMLGAAMHVMQTFGAPAPPGAGGPAARPTPPRDFLRDLRGIAAALSRKFDATVLVDPMLFVEDAPRMPADAASIEAALDVLTKPIHGAAWRRVYVTRPQPGTALTAEALARSARALDAMRLNDLIVVNAATKRLTALGRRRDAEKALPADLRAAGFDPKPVYLVYARDASDAAGLSAMERYADLQRQQLEMMLSMGAQDLSQSMQQAIGLYQNGDPGTRGQLMGLPIMAGMMAVWFPRAAKERQ